MSAPAVDAERTSLTVPGDDPAMATEHAVRGSGETNGLLPVVAERS